MLNRWPTAISTKPHRTQLTPSSAERARRERRHPKASTSGSSFRLDPLENAIDVKGPLRIARSISRSAGSGHSSARSDCSDLNAGRNACSCRNGKIATTFGMLGFVDRGLARGLPRHPQKGAARSISQPHPIRIFEERPRRTCTLFFSLFFESPLMIHPSRAFEYFVHPFQ